MIYPEFNQLLNLQARAKKLQLRLKDRVSSVASGDYSTKIYGSGLEFEGVREYVFGDDTRNIDWRVTARTGEPHSKLFTIESEQSVNIIVDMNANMYFGTKSTFKSSKAAEAAALIGWFFNQSGNRVGAMIFGNKEKTTIFSPTKTKQSLLRFLQKLSEKTIGKIYIPLHSVLKNIHKITAANSRIYIISDFSNFDEEKISKDLSRLTAKGCNITFLQIIDEKDYKIPSIGTISFQSADGNKVIIDTDNQSGKKKYEEIWQTNQQSLEKMVNKMGIKLITINTDDDIYLKLKNNLWKN